MLSPIAIKLEFLYGWACLGNLITSWWIIGCRLPRNPALTRGRDDSITLWTSSISLIAVACAIRALFQLFSLDRKYLVHHHSLPTYSYKVGTNEHFRTWTWDDIDSSFLWNNLILRKKRGGSKSITIRTFPMVSTTKVTRSFRRRTATSEQFAISWYRDSVMSWTRQLCMQWLPITRSVAIRPHERRRRHIHNSTDPHTAN